jgi:hypothetical protein
LNIIQLVITGIGIVLLFLAIIVGVSVTNHASDWDPHIKGLIADITAGIIIFMIIICIAAFVLSVSIQSCLFLLIIYFSSYLQVIIVKLAFKLARAIDANQRLIIQQA